MKKKIKQKLRKLEKEFPHIKFKYKVKFTLISKRIIGTYQYRYYKKNILNFNYNIAQKVGYKRFKEVIIHELGHFITRELYGYNVSAHGKEWRTICIKMGAIKPRATISFLKNSESFQTHFKMKCKCKNKHLYTQNKRTRLRNGTIYRCNSCKKKIREI